MGCLSYFQEFNIPIMSTTKRRRFLQQLGIGTASLSGLPFHLDKNSNPSSRNILQTLRKSTLYDEPYWEMVKRQFTVKTGYLMVNSANLCPAPYFVTEAVDRYSRNLAQDVSFQHRSHFHEKRERVLAALAKYLGTSSQNIGITRNTSEANNIVVNGLDLGPGDEVIIWDQNHPSNNITWKHRAKRHGFKVVEVSVPPDPGSAEELIASFTEAITPDTRVISFSHVSNVSGIHLPVKEICVIANKRGIYTLIDGAQTVGFLDVHLDDLACSFYTASTHKWLMGPMENGILFVHPDIQEELWPNIMAAGWNEKSSTVDDKFCVLGQRNTPGTAALIDIIEFHQSIGKKAIEKRIYQLNSYLKNALKESFHSIQFVTPYEEELSGGVTIFKIPGKDAVSLFQQLYSDYKIAAAPTGGLRISPTINSTLSDMDRVVEAVKELSGD